MGVKRVRVLLGSTCGLERGAVAAAFHDMGYEEVIVNGVCTSPQPRKQSRGIDEILDNAFRRAGDAEERATEIYDYVVGIESGLLGEPQLCFDVQAAVVRRFGGSEGAMVGLSQGVRMPEEYVRKAEELFDDGGIGDGTRWVLPSRLGPSQFSDGHRKCQGHVDRVGDYDGFQTRPDWRFVIRVYPSIQALRTISNGHRSKADFIRSTSRRKSSTSFLNLRSSVRLLSPQEGNFGSKGNVAGSTRFHTFAIVSKRGGFRFRRTNIKAFGPSGLVSSVRMTSPTVMPCESRYSKVGQRSRS